MPWSGYGIVLWQGRYIYDRDFDMHLVYRTGPFCPSIYRTGYNSACPVLIVKKDVLHHLTESAKSKRSIKIGEKLKSVNELYPLDYENWMMEYWPKNI